MEVAMAAGEAAYCLAESEVPQHQLMVPEHEAMREQGAVLSLFRMVPTCA